MTYELIQVAADIPGSEGPVFDRKGRFFVVASPNGSVIEIDEAAGTTREHANTGGIPAGLQVDADNNLWVADMKLGILRVSPDGQVADAVRQFEGQPIRGCNDCAFDSKGNLYFTAPAGSNAENHVGELFCLTADGKVHRLDEGYAFCNGLAVDADDRTLIVAETFTKSLWAYDLDAPGTVSNKRLFAKLPGDDAGGPDGMDFDVEGNLLVAHWKGSSIDVFDPQGSAIERIETPFDRPSNVHFGGEDGKSIYITELSNGAVWRTTWRCAGQNVIC